MSGHSHWTIQFVCQWQWVRCVNYSSSYPQNVLCTFLLLFWPRRSIQNIFRWRSWLLPSWGVKKVPASPAGRSIISFNQEYSFGCIVSLDPYPEVWPLNVGWGSCINLHITNKNVTKKGLIPSYREDMRRYMVSERHIWVKSKIYAFFYFRRILSPG